MKKSILMLGLAVAAMTSCTNDEVLEQAQSTQKAIGFEAFTNKTTKAVTETTDALLSKFYVFGYYGTTNVFTNETVTKEGEDTASDSEWGYDDENTQYWTANEYYFAAYADGNGDGENTNSLTTAGTEGATTPTVAFANQTLTITDYVVSDEKDLVADVVGVDNTNLTNTTVDFTFKHLLSKIKFVIRNTSDEYRMRIVSVIVNPDNTGQNLNSIQGLCIIGVKTTGTCTFLVGDETPSWTAKTGSPVRQDFVPYSATDGVTEISAGLFGKMEENGTGHQKETESYFVMPQDPSEVTFEIRAEFLDDNNQVVSQKQVTGNLKGNSSLETWQPGYFYTYTISLPTSAIPIEFGVNPVEGFEEADPIELNTNESQS